MEDFNRFVAGIFDACVGLRAGQGRLGRVIGRAGIGIGAREAAARCAARCIGTITMVRQAAELLPVPCLTCLCACRLLGP